MSRMMENVATINSFIRTLMGMVVCGVLAVAGWFGYQTYNAGDIAQADLKQAQADLSTATEKLGQVEKQLSEKNVALTKSLAEIREKNDQIDRQQVQIVDLEDTVDEQQEVIEKQKIAMRLLKQDERLALISVLDQSEEDGQLYTTIRWVEIDDQGNPIDEPRNFRLKGDIVKIDAWVVKFDDQYIEDADLLRGTSICLFRRVHGEFPQPDEVYTLDKIGTLPNAYRRGDVSDFERKIWDDFWIIANDTEKAEELGIRAAHGEVVYNKVQPGKKYKLTLRASGGLTMKPVAKDDVDRTTEPAA